MDSIDLIAIIILLGIAQGFFMGTFLLFTRGPNARANRFLGILFCSFSMSIVHFFLDRTGLYAQYPHLMRTSIPVLFLFGPLFYFYVRILTQRTTRLRWVHLLHAVPFTLAVLMFLPFYLSSAEVKLQGARDIAGYLVSPVWHLFSTLQVIHLFAYMIAVRRILGRYNERIRNTQSSIERINLRWLLIGNNLFFFVFGLILLLIFLQALGVPTLGVYSISVPLIVTVIIYGLGFWGLRQPDIFSPAEDVAARKYEKSALTPPLTKELAEKVQAFMAAQKPYLNTELTLPMLAGQLNIPQHQLSQVINEAIGLNFFDFVNGHRVEEAKRLLLDPAKGSYTVIAIAVEAGFNSKSAFNAVFKKQTGQTPSEFRQKAQKGTA